ncbi:aldose epimerase family protein [Massilia sp. CF038]|uniref:aldose epimerase family protein n=1 Tax=Massilia sp. CF038 TaxID=1881045 RepID=UPI001E2993D9|nr:aldose epimerase family protein [Massilia sp. CF038]
MFGALSDGREVTRYTLRNRSGLVVKLIDFGGIITEIHTPDRAGELGDIVLGYDNLAQYEQDAAYFGALVGRYANRICQSRFSLDGRSVALAPNDGAHHLHGGPIGFNKVLWKGEPFASEGSRGVALTYRSKNMEQGYPGTVEVRATYELNDENELLFGFSAVTDAPTPINLTQHSYFNLSGAPDILSHQLRINAHFVTAIDAESIPLGIAMPVDGTPFDFRTARSIGEGIGQEHAQLKNGQGYDHNFVLTRHGADELVCAATLHEPTSGRVLELFTQEPGVQFYSGNFLDGALGGKRRRYGHRSGLCLEPQHFPDSPNQPQFPSTILRPGQTYATQSKYVFSCAARLPGDQHGGGP